jgi:hypothetical protein
MYKFTSLILILSACTRIVPGTALQLNALSPLEADPAGFAVAMALPVGLGIELQSARLMFMVARTDTGETRGGAFVLERVSADQTIYQIAPRDLNALRALQDVARQWKTEGDDVTSGSLSVTMSPCRVGAGPADDARASVDIRIDADGPFLPLIRKGPISALAEPEQIRNMGTCSIHR